MQKLKSKIIEKNQYKKLLYNQIEVEIVHPTSKYVDVNKVLKKIEDMIPYNLFSGHVKKVIFGNFDFFKKRDFNAYYDENNKLIYIRSEQQDDNIDLLDDIAHEISHAVEQKYHKQIYDDGRIKAEFIKKRLKMFYSIIIDYGQTIDSKKFLVTSFDEELDNFFYKVIGYEKMKKYISNTFPSAYAPTSLSEYWAEGFEKYILGHHKELSIMCPRLFNKIDSLFKGAQK